MDGAAADHWRKLYYDETDRCDEVMGYRDAWMKLGIDKIREVEGLRRELSRLRLELDEVTMRYFELEGGSCGT